jgi:uncharacterized membrane protein YqiK
MAVLTTIGAIILVLVVLMTILGTIFTRLYRKVSQGQALIISKARHVDVTFTGATVWPVVHRAEVMDVGVKVIQIEKNGNDGLICNDNMRADIRVSFYVRVNPTADDVRKVAQLVGCVNASSQAKLEELFSAKFAEALKTAGKQMEFVQLYEQREGFRANVINVIGNDLNGYVLDDVAIEYLEQTPLDQLDPSNVLDAEGIKKITDITSRENIAANHYRREAEKQIKAKDVETQQAVFEMERQEKAAEYRAMREVATTKAKEESLTAVVETEERLKAEAVRLRADEQIGIQRENNQREIEVAGKNRERSIAVETEKVEKARQLEVVARQIETTVASRDLETEKGRIAELAKGRVAAEKTVAEQEESIKTMRVVEDANRGREATVIAAGAKAEAVLITTIKEAEAKEKASVHIAKERMTLADANRAASELDTVAMMRRAEGSRAEAAAYGLAGAEVKMAEAIAIEATLKSEAAGLLDKAAAMKQLEGVGKEYDLAVKNIDADVQVRTAAIGAQKDAAIAQSEALGLALASAKIDIVGGTDMFVDRILGGAATGKAIGSFANGSDASRAITLPYVNGEKDAVELLANSVAGLGASGIANITLARALSALAGRLGGTEGVQLGEIVKSLQARGLGDVDVRSLVAGITADAK